MHERAVRPARSDGWSDAPPRAFSARRTAAAVGAITVVGALLTAATATAVEPFTELIDFEAYERTALDGQDGWVASAAPRVVADPLNGNNQVVESVGGGQQSYRAIPPIANGDTGTLFFRFLRTGSVDTSCGLTDVDAPNDYAPGGIATEPLLNPVPEPALAELGIEVRELAQRPVEDDTRDAGPAPRAAQPDHAVSDEGCLSNEAAEC